MNINGMDFTAEVGQEKPKKRKPWGWRVVRDYGFDPVHDEPQWNRQGKTYRDYQGGKFRYRLKDDDGNTMYIIESDIDPNKGTEGQLFAPLDWAMNDVGATSIEYKDEEGNYQYL
jgi:hypothetical protein